MSNGNEPNRPNTADACNDGNSGSYHSDESIDRVTVRSVDGSDFKAGTVVSIDAQVFAWSTGSQDYAHFYYSTSATSLSWKFLGTKKPSSGGAQTISMQHTLPSGSFLQAVRVVFVYNTSGGAQNSCPGGSYDDVDDLVFAVTGGVSTPAVCSEDVPSKTHVVLWYDALTSFFYCTLFQPTNNPITPAPTNLPTAQPSNPPSANPTKQVSD